MKLRNKKTGEILEDTDILGLMAAAKNDFPIYRSLAKLNEEWEDYEGPEETALEEIIRKLESDFKMYPSEWNNLEEAKRVVEQLKTWKKLKDERIRVDTLDFESEE